MGQASQIGGDPIHTRVHAASDIMCVDLATGTDMDDSNGYAVFFFPQALEALGDAIKPYLQEGDAGPHVLCSGIDTGGALIEMSLQRTDANGTPVEMELMVPSGMVRMIVSAHSDGMFGFAARAQRDGAQKTAPPAQEARPEAAAAPAATEPLVAASTPETKPPAPGT